MNIIGILGAVLAFSLLIIAHELGHFTLAKLNGVKVEEFSLGMGPKVLGFKGKETEYLIKAFPIGGYVKMLGEEADVNDPRAFSNKSSLQKLSIIAAGPIMNLILAVVIFSIVGSFGFAIPVVNELIEGKPAQVAGLMKGDRIVEINNKKVATWQDLSGAIYTSKGDTLYIKLVRDGKTFEKTVLPVKEGNEYLIGIRPAVENNPSAGQIISYGFKESGSMIKGTFDFLAGVFQRKVSANDVGGPITIIRVASEAAKAGIIPLLSLTAYISIQLGIFNIIPFPALDGGWIFLFLFETITRKKVDPNKVGVINTVGFALLMVVMVLVIVKDVLYPIKLN